VNVAATQLNHMRPAMSHEEEEELWMYIDLAADHRSAARLNDEVTCLMAGIGKPFSESAWDQMVPELVMMWQVCLSHARWFIASINTQHAH
jgi:hypothetical protein